MSPSVTAFLLTVLAVQLGFLGLTVLFARLARVHVPWVSLGLGPPVGRVRLGHTELRLGAVPLGSSASLGLPREAGEVPPEGLRWFDQTGRAVQLGLRLGPWLLLWGLAAALRPGSLGGVPAAWVLALRGAVQPWSVGAEALGRAWEMVSGGAPTEVALGTLGVLVAINLLPFPPMAPGEVLLVAVPEGWRDRLRVGGVLVQLAWVVGWGLAAWGWATG